MFNLNITMINVWEKQSYFYFYYLFVHQDLILPQMNQHSAAASSIEELVYEDANGNLVNEDLTNKKTLVVFWADYWGICREELPLLEANLAAVSQNYDVIALAHSDVDSTMTWVSENLKGEITIGFSTSDMRDNLKIIGQPISLIIDTDGNILSREYGYVPNDL